MLQKNYFTNSATNSFTISIKRKKIIALTLMSTVTKRTHKTMQLKKKQFDKFFNFFHFFLKTDIMDLRHQSSAMCIIMLGGEDTHPWSATKVVNPIPATLPVTKKKQPTNYSNQPLCSRPVEFFLLKLL